MDESKDRMTKQIGNITDDDRREISQLWFIASYYFECATKISNEVDKYLEKTVQEITDIYKKQCKPDCSKEEIPQDILKKIMLLNAHLGSCAVRLCTIDEILGQKYNSSERWSSYTNLQGQLKQIEGHINDKAHEIANISVHRILFQFHFEQYESDPSQEKFLQKFIEELYRNVEHDIKKIVDYIKNDANKTIHFLLRHNIAHSEPDFHSKNKKYQIISEVLQRFAIKKLYTNLENVKNAIEKDISSIIEEYSKCKIDFNCC